MPIVAVTPNEKNYHQLAFNWGVQSRSLPRVRQCARRPFPPQQYALAHGIISFGDVVVVTAGSPSARRGRPT